MPQQINRFEIHATWSGLVQSWKAVWLASHDRPRWANFVSHCDRLLAISRAQGIPEIETALAPLIQLLEDIPQYGEAEKIAVHRLLPSVFTVVREVCIDSYHRSADQRYPGDETLPLVVMITAQPERVRELVQQMEYYGYTLQICEDPDQALQLAATRRAAAVVLDAPQGLQPDQHTLVDHLHRQGIKWFVLAEQSGFVQRLQAVRHGAHGFFVAPVSVSTLVDVIDPIAYKANDEPYRVLILDDSMTVLATIKKTLEQFQNINLRTLRQPELILDTLLDFSPDVLLLDFHMQSCNGLEVAKIIRQNKAFESIPIVYLTSETSEEVQLEAMRNGGDDFLTKPIGKAQLVNSVLSRAERYRGLRKLMVEDSLTGLYNHVKTKALLQQALLLAERQKVAVSYAILDIDHFKRVNDNYGHSVGDKVIKTLARFLKQRVRRADIVGRYGGEEFAIVFFNSDAAASLERLETIRLAFSQVQHSHDGGNFTVTFSAGIAHFPAYTQLMDMMVAADDALYAAKRGGRNCVTLAGQSK